MPYLVSDQKSIYYERYGQGEKNLMILNGIMMSTNSWHAFIDHLSSKYTLILVDFFDQGKSDYLADEYDQQVQVEVIKDVIKTLALDHLTLLGISYGGEVAMKFAHQNPNLLDALILSNTTAFTSPQLKAIGDNWVHAAQTYEGEKFFKATIPPIYSSGFYEREQTWLTEREKMFVQVLNKKWYDGFVRLVISAEKHDERENLKKITCPTLVIGADEDVITPIPCQVLIAKEIPKSYFIVIKSCGHASMYEKPHEFISAIEGFIDSNNVVFKIK